MDTRIESADGPTAIGGLGGSQAGQKISKVPVDGMYPSAPVEFPLQFRRV